MRDRTTSYNQLLRAQSTLTYSLEKCFFQSSIWNSAKNVLDYGSGNSSYAFLLAKDSPNKAFTCVERDEKLAQIARTEYAHPNITVVTGSYEELRFQEKFDFILLRHLTSYLSNRQAFCEWIANISSAAAGVLVIDADDELFLAKPELPIFQSGIEKFRQRVSAEGGQRDVRTAIESEWKTCGFVPLFSQRIIVNSDIGHSKELTYLYMYLIAELDYGSPVRNDLAEELLSWVFNPSSYIQYGLFGTFFHRSLDGKLETENGRGS